MLPRCSTRMPSVKFAASESAHVMRTCDPSVLKVTPSRSSRSRRGRGTTGASSRRTTLVGISCRMCEYDQRVRGKRVKLLSAKRISRSVGGGEPTIHFRAAGSVAAASSRVPSSVSSGGGVMRVAGFYLLPRPAHGHGLRKTLLDDDGSKPPVGDQKPTDSRTPLASRLITGAAWSVGPLGFS